MLQYVDHVIYSMISSQNQAITDEYLNKFILISSIFSKMQDLKTVYFWQNNFWVTFWLSCGVDVSKVLCLPIWSRLNFLSSKFCCSTVGSEVDSACNRGCTVEDISPPPPFFLFPPPFSCCLIEMWDSCKRIFMHSNVDHAVEVNAGRV